MRRPIKSKWLIRLASELAGEGAGQGQPRNTNLRRAASTAYYALFHAIGTAVAAEALPSGSDAEKSGYGRYVNHAAIKQVCDWISGSQPPVHLQDVVTRLRQNSRLSAVASSFVTLQEQREAADYDHGADFTKPVTLALVGRARGAVADIRAQKTTDDFRSFFGLVALQTSVRNR